MCRYIHNKDWENAERVAETYDDSAMADVLVEQAKEEFQLKNYSRFESLLLRAHKPEMIISLYKVCNYNFFSSEFLIRGVLSFWKLWRFSDLFLKSKYEAYPKSEFAPTKRYLIKKF